MITRIFSKLASYSERYSLHKSRAIENTINTKINENQYSRLETFPDNENKIEKKFMK
jgi:hypothetical protein